MIILKILSVILMVSGFLLVALSKFLVRKFKLNEKQTCNFENEMSENELCEYLYNKAVVNMKMLGMLIALPGIVIMVVVFK
ncbi:MAG: hypothetical protein Q8920_16315 [Bacillota bacterium]|nr:hypothetical protein [Bacillota bacterium]